MSLIFEPSPILPGGTTLRDLNVMLEHDHFRFEMVTAMLNLIDPNTEHLSADALSESTRTPDYFRLSVLLTVLAVIAVTVMIVPATA